MWVFSSTSDFPSPLFSCTFQRVTVCAMAAALAFPRFSWNAALICIVSDGFLPLAAALEWASVRAFFARWDVSFWSTIIIAKLIAAVVPTDALVVLVSCLASLFGRAPWVVYSFMSTLYHRVAFYKPVHKDQFPTFILQMNHKSNRVLFFLQ